MAININEVHRVNDAIIRNPYMPIVTRTQWGAATPQYSGLEPDWNYTTIVIHHAGPRGKTDLRQIQHDEMNRSKEPFSDIGYHFCVSPPRNGHCTVYQGRYLGFKGSSVEGQNTGKLAICHLGNYAQKITHQSEAEWENDIRLMVETTSFLISILRRYMNTLREISGHRDWFPPGGTECPGDHLYRYIPYLAQATGLSRVTARGPDPHHNLFGIPLPF